MARIDTGGRERNVRLFIGLDVPADVRLDIEHQIEPWRGRIDGARWIPPANWHVTLKFLGSTDPAFLPWIEQKVEATVSGRAPITTRIDGSGCFPSARRARVAWVGIDDPGSQISELAADLDRDLAARFRPSKRPFTPHLTVARIDPPTRVPDGFSSSKRLSEPFEIDRVVLYESRLGRPDATYEPLSLAYLKSAAI